MIQSGKVVERINRDRVTKVPLPTQAANLQRTDVLDARAEDAAKHTDGETWLVANAMDHRVIPEVGVGFLVKWNEPYDPTWEPRRNIPKELISRYLMSKRRKSRMY